MIHYIIAAGIGAFLGSQSKKSKKSYAHGGEVDYGEIRERLQSLDLPTDAGDRTELVEEINLRYGIVCSEVIRASSDDDIYIAVDGLLRDYGVYAERDDDYAKGGEVKFDDYTLTLKPDSIITNEVYKGKYDDDTLNMSESFNRTWSITKEQYDKLKSNKPITIEGGNVSWEWRFKVTRDMVQRVEKRTMTKKEVKFAKGGSTYAEGGEIKEYFHKNLEIVKSEKLDSFGEDYYVIRDRKTKQELVSGGYMYMVQNLKSRGFTSNKEVSDIISKAKSVKGITSMYSKGGQTTPPITNYHKNIMGTLSFDLKVKGMRKSQDFIVYPIREKTDTIKIQSDKKFGEINILTGRGVLSKSGSAMYHLSLDKARNNVNEFHLSKGEVQELKTQIKSTTGKSVGGSFVKSDNSAADLLEKGGEVREAKNDLIEVLNEVDNSYNYYGVQDKKEVFIIKPMYVRGGNSADDIKEMRSNAIPMNKLPNDIRNAVERYNEAKGGKIRKKTKK